jgi:hypothetical protein
VRGAQRFGLVGAVLELGGDGEGGLDGQRGEGIDEQLPDPHVEAGAGDGLADPAGVLDAVALAEVGGELDRSQSIRSASLSRPTAVKGHRPAAITANGSAGTTSVHPAGSENSTPSASCR